MERSIRRNSSKLQEEGMAFEDVKTVQTTGGHNRGGPRSTAKRAELKRPSTESRSLSKRKLPYLLVYKSTPPPLSRSKIEFLIISGKTNEFHINRNFPENVLKTPRIKKSNERKIAR